jgi:MYXO-CTERM domain-containing protein
MPGPDSDDPDDTWEADAPSWIAEGDVLDPVDPDPGPGPGPGIDALIVGIVPPLDPVANHMQDFELVGIESLDDDVTQGFSGPLSSEAAGGAIPTPGTLALLGLAALTLRRRRRA